MTDREKIIEIIKKNGTYNGRSLSFDYYVIQPDDLADALIAAGVGDVKVLETALHIAECDSFDYTYDDFIEQAEKELAEEKIKIKYKKDSDKSWLASCPPNDCNFKSHLKTATKQDLQELIAELPEKGNITKIKALKAELKRREKQ